MSAKKRVPKLRFRGFSGEWDEEKLGYISNITIGEFVIRTKQNPNALYPVYNGGKSNTGFYNEFNNTGNKIIISARGANAGYVNFEKRNYWAGNSCYSISMIDEKIFFINYFYYFIKKYEYKFKDNQQSANIPSVSKDDAEKFKVKFPKFKEQTKIGNYFQNLDKLIEQKEKKYQKLGQLKKAILEKMFPKEGATTPEIRFKGFSGEWEEERLGELSEYKNGKGHEDKQKTSGQYELINLNSISINGGLKHSGKFIDETDITLNKNDLVMILSDVGHGDLLGRVALIPENNRFVLNQRVALLRPQKNIIPLFLFYNINAHQKYFKLQGAGMSQLNISRSSVEDFISYFPLNLHEQTKIGNYFQKLDHLIDLQNQELQKLKNIKKASLAKMFV